MREHIDEMTTAAGPLTELTYRITRDKEAVWEHRLRLFIRPRPKECPPEVWAGLLNLVLLQTDEERV